MNLSHTISTLETSGLIRPAQAEPELEYIFRHALVQDAAYDSLLKADRRALHAAVAETLEKIYATRLDEIAATLADHYERAENYPVALQYSIRAAKADALVYANAESAALFERAIEISALPEAHANADLISDLYSQYGRVLELSGQFNAAIEAYRQMQAEAIRRRERRMEMDALIAQAILQATPSPIHNSSQAQLLCEQALGIAQALKNPEAESRIYWILMLIHNFGRDVEKAVEYGEKSLSIARAIANRERMAFTLNDISRSYATLGQVEKANACLSEARQLWEELGNLPMLADNISTYAESVFSSGNLPEMLLNAQRAYEISKKINNAWGMGYALSLQARAYWNMGESRQAIERLAEIDSVYNGNMPPFVAMMTTALKMDIYCEMGDNDTARRFVEAIDTAAGLTGATFDGFREIARAYLAIAFGNLAEARIMLLAAQSKVSERTFNAYAPFYRGAVEYALASADSDPLRAVEFFTQQVQSFGASQMKIIVPPMRYWLGSALLQAGQVDAAAEELLSALEGCQHYNLPRFLWKAHAALAQVADQRGESSTATLHRHAARMVIQSLAQRAPAELGQRYLQQPAVRNVLNALP